MNRNLTTSERAVSFATNYIGLQEIKGPVDNKTIVQMFADIGHKWVKDDETAWCSCFVNWVCLKTGLIRSGKLDARSWLEVGQETSYPQHGDVVVFWRESPDSWKGHVGFFIGYTKSGDIYCLGGNQQNEVNISVYPAKRLLKFRRLS
jgi:uncharacterized protein (TIGR02594 family)